ncbi:hypothetical protein D1007_27647 [Hordeum vulgare]|nr:hypothetical protein D1007_27647 [Hordeum vulgare]
MPDLLCSPLTALPRTPDLGLTRACALSSIWPPPADRVTEVARTRLLPPCCTPARQIWAAPDPPCARCRIWPPLGQHHTPQRTTHNHGRPRTRAPPARGFTVPLRPAPSCHAPELPPNQPACAARSGKGGKQPRRHLAKRALPGGACRQRRQRVELGVGVERWRRLGFAPWSPAGATEGSAPSMRVSNGSTRDNFNYVKVI